MWTLLNDLEYITPNVSLSVVSIAPETKIVPPALKVYVVSWFEKNYEFGLHDDWEVSAVFVQRDGAERYVAEQPRDEKSWNIQEFEVADYPPQQEQNVQHVTAAP
jgi:hypothetical protein